VPVAKGHLYFRGEQRRPARQRALWISNGAMSDRSRRRVRQRSCTPNIAVGQISANVKLQGRMLLDSPVNAPRIVYLNRRADPRIPADKLHWLDAVRLTFGVSVSLIDLSMRGASFEVPCRIRAGDPTEFELIAERERTLAPARILRSEVVDVRPESLRYRGACTFDMPLPWPGRLRTAAVGQDRSLGSANVYEPWPGWSEILIVFRHGRRLRGYTHAFSGADPTLDVWPSRAAVPRERQVVPLALLRTISVVRDFGGDGSSLSDRREATSAFPNVEIAFKNGQLMFGATPGYEEDRLGLWLLPRHSPNVLRVFAVSSAVAEIRVF
jgi:hypothetical protein